MLTDQGVDLLEVREAAAIAHRAPETIRRWVWSGRLDAQRRGNRLLVARSDVERLAQGSSHGLATDTEQPLSLREWDDMVKASRRSGPLPAVGASATDLVLEDRGLREGA